jgi:hypothetical protein
MYAAAWIVMLRCHADLFIPDFQCCSSHFVTVGLLFCRVPIFINSLVTFNPYIPLFHVIAFSIIISLLIPKPWTHEIEIF